MSVEKIMIDNKKDSDGIVKVLPIFSQQNMAEYPSPNFEKMRLMKKAQDQSVPSS